MKLKDVLFSEPDISIYQIIEKDDWDEEWADDDWDDDLLDSENPLNKEAIPIDAPILAAEYITEGIFDGSFILKAIIVTKDSKNETGYLLIVMPEGVVCGFYMKEGGVVVEKDSLEMVCTGKKMIPVVAFQGYIDYEIYYSKLAPEIGLGILTKALDVAKEKWSIASAIAHILRDEKQYKEAIEAISMSMEDSPDYLQYQNYLGRASLFEQLGNKEAAERDRKEAEFRRIQKLRRYF